MSAFRANGFREVSCPAFRANGLVSMERIEVSKNSIGNKKGKYDFASGEVVPLDN